MEVTVRTWGNSLGIRIPKQVLTEMKLKESDILEIETVNATITLRKKSLTKPLKKGLLIMAVKLNLMISTGASQRERNWYERILSRRYYQNCRLQKTVVCHHK